jgi:regulatory protein
MTRKITALQPQKKNPKRVNVYLDGDFAFGLSRIVSAWLEIGQEISDEKIKQLKDNDAQEIAIQQAIKFISYRPRSTEEVRKNLQKHNLNDEVVELVIQKCLNNGLLDDKQFAKTWIENRSEFRPSGKRALEFELKQHGINPQIIDPLLENLDEETLAYKATLKKSNKFLNSDYQTFRQKLYRHLNQRGFSYDVILTAINQVWDNIKTEDSPFKEEEVDL